LGVHEALERSIIKCDRDGGALKEILVRTGIRDA